MGQVVRVQPSRHGRQWFKAKIIDQVAPRSYKILTDTGSILCRNRRQLRPSPGEVFTSDGGNDEYSLGEDENEMTPVEREGEEEEDGEEEEEGIIDRCHLQFVLSICK